MSSTVTSASRAVARPLSRAIQTKQTLIVKHSAKTGSAVRFGSGGSSPPLPPFARIPKPSEKLVEEHDLIWDDGVAPEVTIDFDAPHISKEEGALWWLGGLGFFFMLYQLIGLTDPESKNPAVNRSMNIVVENPKTGPPESD